jgi:hypothetical protein
MIDSQKEKPSVKVDHTYKDYSHVTTDTPTEDIEYEDSVAGMTMPGGTRGTDSNFPAKLHHILSRPDLSHIVTWLPHGRSWRLVDRHAFLNQVMPHYFSHSNYASFARQVNGWGFKRLSRKGSDYGSYYHELFLRGMPHVAKRMRRPLKIGKKLCPDPENEPDFEKISRKFPLPEASPSKWSIGAFSLPAARRIRSPPDDNESQLQNLFNTCGILKNICDAVKHPQLKDRTNDSIRLPTDVFPNTGLTPNSSSLTQESLFQSIYQGFQSQERQTQGSSVHSLLQQLPGPTLAQESTNDILMSNILRYDNLFGRGLLNQIASQSLPSHVSQNQDMHHLMLMQQQHRQSHLNPSLENHPFQERGNRFDVRARADNIKQEQHSSAETLTGRHKALGFNSSALGLDSFRNGAYPTADEAVAATPFKNITSMGPANEDDERSISSDIF